MYTEKLTGADRKRPQLTKLLREITEDDTLIIASLIRYRTEDGRVAARKRGVKCGRKYKLTDHQREKVHRMIDEGASIRGIARHFNVGVATIDRIKKIKIMA